MSELDLIRERGLETITRAYTSDAIPVSEFERRASVIQRARDASAVEAAIADLPPDMPSDASRSKSDERPPSNALDASLAGSQSVACVMGERHLQGDWLTGDRVRTVALMGSVRLDLREVSLPPEGLHIEVFVVMGETVVVVPHGTAVRLDAVPFMGEAAAARDVTQRASPDKPLVRIGGLALMGSIRVIAAD